MVPNRAKSIDFRDDLQFTLDDSTMPEAATLPMVSPTVFTIKSVDGCLTRSLFESHNSDVSLMIRESASLAKEIPVSTPLTISNNRRTTRPPRPPQSSSLSIGADHYLSEPASTSVKPKVFSSSLIDKRIALYKTEICRTFEETGICRYGNKCQFAHYPGELRAAPKHPRYKTEICRTYWEKGTCPYGKRCCFIHNELSGLSPLTSISPHSFGGRLNSSLPAAEASISNGESKILKRLEKIAKPTFDGSPRVTAIDDDDLWSEEFQSHQHLTFDVLQMMDE